jgi:hypothetical protein
VGTHTKTECRKAALDDCLFMADQRLPTRADPHLLRIKRRAIFERIQPIKRALNEHPYSVQRKAGCKRGERDGVIRVASEYFGKHVSRARDKLNTESVLDGIRGYLCSEYCFVDGHSLSPDSLKFK